jgi:hypothetical protein
MPTTPEGVRWDIANAHKRRQSIDHITRLCKVARKVAALWVQRYKETCEVVPKPKTGRKRALSEAQEDKAMELLLSPEYEGASHVARELASGGITAGIVSRPTVIAAARRAAARQGTRLVAVQGKPKPGLSRRHKDKRLAFAAAESRRRWDRVMFTDSKIFRFKHPGVRVTRTAWKKQGRAGCRPEC